MDETKLLIPKDNGMTVKLDKTGLRKQSPSHQWVGLTMQELVEFSSDPFWIRMRYFCFGVFWCSFIILSVATGVLVFSAPRCRKPEWWQEGPMYGVFSLDFRENASTSEEEGLSGIESKLDYIVELGVKTIWLSPIYKSPMIDFGYDIEDFKEIDARFGTLQDFRDLITSMKARELRLVMDLVPNHSSDQHEWFQKSKAKIDPYTDYYVWVDPKGFDGDKPIVPNNWLSVFGGSAWEWNEDRKQFYLHQFAKEQPDLNFRNIAVKNEMLDVMRFWLEMGVDGFRMDAIPHLFEDTELKDEPTVNETMVQRGEYDGLRHVHTYNLPEVFSIMEDFRKALDAYSEQTDKVRKLLYLKLGNISPYLIQLGNHDHGRMASRYGGDLVDCLNMILLMLPGTAVTYYGEELGMENTPVSWELTVDPAGLNVGPEYYKEHSRDPERTPMQWSPDKNAGFSDADSIWLPLHPNYTTVNVETQRSQLLSHLNVYKSLVRARSDHSVMYGSLVTKVFNDSVFAFTRGTTAIEIQAREGIVLTYMPERQD
ncbi:Maltase 1 [Blattella germanica]|nr:Maltase 1 [Blattella germanica]